MNFSKKACETVDACRFCWMCRHICPVGNATGQERDTARARALSLSMVTRGEEYTADKIDNVYECSLCGACTQDCLTGWDPKVFVADARLGAALDGKLPEYIEKLVDKALKTGNVYGKKALDKELAAEIAKLPKKADTVLFLGADARYKSPKSALAAIAALKKAKVSFTVLADEPDSGYSLNFLIGAAEETRAVMNNCAKTLSAFKTVICYDPADAKTFLREYKEWKIALKADIITFPAELAKLIKSGALKKANGKKEYTFQDPALLARDLDDVKSARAVINAVGKNKEMLLNSKATVLAGHLIMSEYMPDVMKKIASDRWVNAANIGATAVVTASVSEYEALRATKPKNIELYRLEEIVL